jgi:hypothetical protein
MATPTPTPTPKDPEAAFGTRQPPAHSPIPTTLDRDPRGAGSLGLSRQETDQFRESGYVIKRGLIPPATFSSFIKLWWQQPPVRVAHMVPADAGTWVSPGRHWPADNRWGLASNWMGSHEWPSAVAPRPGATVGERVGRLPYKLTRDVGNDIWRWHGIGHDPEFVTATSAHPNVLRMAELLLGGPVKRPKRNRGIYAIFPRAATDPETRLGPHMDQSMTEMMAVIYLQDVGPRAGGFTVFPTSPQRMYPTSAQGLNWVATERSETALNAVMAEVQPLEFTGQAGDVLFCHGWMVHSAGIHESDRIRMAVVADFNKVRERSHMRWTAAAKGGGRRVNCDMSGVFTFPEDGDDDPADGLREVTNQWHMDCNEFARSQQQPFADMFSEWNLGQRPVAGHVVDEPAWWEKYNLPHLPAGITPRGGGGTPAVPLDSIASYEGAGRWRVRSRANDWMKGRQK